MSESHTAKYADSMAETISEMVADLTNEDEEIAETGRENMDDWPLEIVWQMGSPFEVVLTAGGPDARIVHDVRFSDWTLEVRWGGDVEVRRSADIRTAGEYFLALVDES